jgi:predicted transcriptional regulator
VGELADVRRLRLLLELSSARATPSQTDCHAYPTELEIELNGVTIHRSVLPNHPHDTRGSLSYLRGGKGAYGYLVNTVIEGPMLDEVRRGTDRHLRLVCRVPEGTRTPGGLTVYGAECGHCPTSPTLILEW